MLLADCCFGALIVPLAQLHYQTPWSIDNHLGYGIWFAAIPAGYACSKFIRWIPGARGQLQLSAAWRPSFTCRYGWQSAWDRYHAWPDANAFINSLRRVAAQSQEPIYLPANQVNIAGYYTQRGPDWVRWNSTLSLDPTAIPRNTWEDYYSRTTAQWESTESYRSFTPPRSLQKAAESILFPYSGARHRIKNLLGARRN